MRSPDEGDEHLNMKGAACDLLSPRAVHLQEIDSYKTQKKPPHKQGIKRAARIVYYKVTFKHLALITSHYGYQGIYWCERAT